MSASGLILNNNKICISASMNSYGTSISINITKALDTPLSPQEIIDVVSDYLIVDPKGMFKEVVSYEPPQHR